MYIRKYVYTSARLPSIAKKKQNISRRYQYSRQMALLHRDIDIIHLYCTNLLLGLLPESTVL